MRVSSGRINGLRGLADFVPGKFPVPTTPSGIGRLGDFAPSVFSLPQNPVGLGHLGCGCGGSCSSCSGMGAIDWSLTGVGIGSEVGLTTVPNYVFYGVGALVAYMLFFETSARPRYTRR